MTKEQLKILKQAIAPGIYPGMNRARFFKDRKKEDNKNYCRKNYKEE